MSRGGQFCFLFPAVITGFLRAEPATTEEPLVWGDDEACGKVALYIVARLRRVPISWDTAGRAVGPANLDGMHTFADLERASRALGLSSLALSVGYEDLLALPTPAIIQTRYFGSRSALHFSVLLAATAEHVTLLDAPLGPHVVQTTQFHRIWTGMVLAFPDSHESASAIRGSVAAKNRRHMGFAAASIMSMMIIVSNVILLIMPSARRATRTISRLAYLLARPLRTRVGGAFALSVTGIAVLYFGMVTRQARPKLVLEKSLIDLGTLPKPIYSMDVPITNEGRVPWRLRRVESSCTCLTVVVPQSVAGGQRAFANIKIDPGSGPRTAAVAFWGEGEREPQRLRLSWTGKTRPNLYPDRLECGEIDGHEKERCVHVLYGGGPGSDAPTIVSLTRGDSPIRYRVGTANPTALDLKGENRARTVGDLPLFITIEAPSDRGRQDFTCKLRLRDSGDEYDYLLPVCVTSRRAISPATDRCLVLVREGVPVAREDVKIDTAVPPERLTLQGPSWCRCTIERVPDGAIWLRIAAPTQLPSRIMTGQIVLEVAADAARRSVIQLYAVKAD